MENGWGKLETIRILGVGDGVGSGRAGWRWRSNDWVWVLGLEVGGSPSRPWRELRLCVRGLLGDNLD
jgi:hypothetical protein